MLRMSEAQYKEKANELFNELEHRARSLGDFELFTEEILKFSAEARALFNENKIPESLKKYSQALAKIEKAEISTRGEALARWLLWFELGCLAALLALGYFTYKWPHFWLWEGLVPNLHLQTAWFGALGGVTIALYGIYNHVQGRDFDPKYKFWYLCKPIIGGIFGWFVYLIYFIGLISVQGLQGAQIKAPELPFAIAFLAGFSERFTIKIIDRLMSVLTTWEETTTEGSDKGKPKPKI